MKEEMTSRERVFAALEHKELDRFPRQQWHLPYVGMYRKHDAALIEEKYPADFIGADVTYGPSYAEGIVGKKGKYTDPFGNVWTVGQDGLVGEVKNPQFEDYNSMKNYKFPMSLLDKADFSRVNAGCKKTDKFVLHGTMTNPFERMQQIRGTENLFMDLAMDEPEIYELRDMFHEFSVKEMNMWANTDVDGVSFMDDWGTQIALLINPEKWRSFYKPLYKEYCDILHAAGKKVFFHSDGHITAIYPDLIEIGVDAINSQLFCMDIEKLGQDYAGKITFWGEIDRQHIMPFGTEQDVRDAVDRVAKALLIRGRTGIIAQCEWGELEPLENILAVYDQWNKW